MISMGIISYIIKCSTVTTAYRFRWSLLLDLLNQWIQFKKRLIECVLWMPLWMPPIRSPPKNRAK